ncbi:ArnT family glycosyltransferase [candidate division CSSED10-310 bacterium]|uniref:ArnT family glycosyltransferase n=1 Tax=candidate division CSSED10-310 bacterium TaxID=2855610 RepID=A0ABV6Z473_UNCC1
MPETRLLRPIRDQRIYVALAMNLTLGKGLICPDIEAVDLEKIPPALSKRLVVSEAVQAGYFRGLVPIGEPTAFWLPFYPLFLSLLLKLAGDYLFFLRLAQSFLGAALVVPVYFITDKMYRHKEWGIIAAVLTACWPFFIYYSAVIMTETLYILLLTCLVAVIVLYQTKYHWIWPLLSGALAGTTFLTRSVMLGLVPLLALVLLIYAPNRRKGILAGASFILVFIICVAPWLVRNYQIFGVYQFLPTKGGPTFWSRNNPLFLQQELESTRFSGINPAQFENEKLLHFPSFQTENEIERNVILYQRMLVFIKKYPATYLKLCLVKFRWLLSPFSGHKTPLWQKSISLLTYGVTLFLALIGLVKFREHRKNDYILVILLGYFILFHSLVNGDTRFRIPLDIFFIILAAPLYHRIIQWCIRKLPQQIGS